MPGNPPHPPPKSDAGAEAVLRGIAERLEAGFNSKGRKTGFLLLTWELGKDFDMLDKPQTNFITNDDQAVMDKAAKNLLENRGFIVFVKAKDVGKLS